MQSAAQKAGPTILQISLAWLLFYFIFSKAFPFSCLFFFPSHIHAHAQCAHLPRFLHLQLLSAPCFSLKTAVLFGFFVCWVFFFWTLNWTEASLAISCPTVLPLARDRYCIHHTSQRGELRSCTPAPVLGLWRASLLCLSTAVLELLYFNGGRADENVVQDCSLPFKFCAGWERTIPECVARLPSRPYVCPYCCVRFQILLYWHTKQQKRAGI